MTRRLSVTLAALSLGLFAVGLWAVHAVRDLGQAFADVVNGR